MGCGRILVSFVLLGVGAGSLVRIDPAARTRTNTVDMVTDFTGGAVGSRRGTRAEVHARWIGVCATGAGLAAIALLLLGIRPLADRPGAVRHPPVT